MAAPMFVWRLSTRRSICPLFPAQNISWCRINVLKGFCNDSSGSKVTHKVAESDNTFSGHIPTKRLQISHCRSSGPGGQNVNKVNSKVEVRFHVNSADWIPEPCREKMLQMYKHMINKEGHMILTSDSTRSQSLNTAECMERLRTLVQEACKPPPEVSPETLLRIQARKARAAVRRVEEKRRQSQQKRLRQPSVDI
ncbi:large ribosomal subunit protein mL62-like isoform X2 [Ornithodoros turicata]|uniref:large ribosomal subunit protein mL62-like isoform X2 n=1 Tax=Ornithodoros turicata TaxID=34597 RepID=UPI00313970D8